MESKSSGKTGWTCEKCTLVNVVASPLCLICHHMRPNIWMCETPKCDTVNQNVSQCRKCLRWNSELEMQREKWMRNEDDSWNCRRCSFKNTPLADRCEICRVGSEEMHLDELKHPAAAHTNFTRSKDIGDIENKRQPVSGKDLQTHRPSAPAALDWQCESCLYWNKNGYICQRCRMIFNSRQ